VMLVGDVVLQKGSCKGTYPSKTVIDPEACRR
jgi:hypothetical protein